MLVQAALLRAHAAIPQDKGAHPEDASDVIAQLLRHPDYDVRQVVLKLLSQWRKSSSPAAALLHNERYSHSLFFKREILIFNKNIFDNS
jgi:hypothetical protein